MNDGVLVVNFAALSQASADIKKALGKLQADLDELERVAAPLVQSWDGPAKEAYAVRQKTWQNAADDLTRILRGIEGALAESAGDYASTEKRATSLFQ